MAGVLGKVYQEHLTDGGRQNTSVQRAQFAAVAASQGNGLAADRIGVLHGAHHIRRVAGPADAHHHVARADSDPMRQIRPCGLFARVSNTGNGACGLRANFLVRHDMQVTTDKQLRRRDRIWEKEGSMDIDKKLRELYEKRTAIDDAIASLKRWESRAPAETAPTNPTDVFISYASDTKSLTEELARALEREGIHAWADFKDLKPGQLLKDEIEEALERAQ